VLTSVATPTIARLPRSHSPAPGAPGRRRRLREQRRRQRGEAVDDEHREDPQQERHAERHRPERHREVEAVDEQALAIARRGGALVHGQVFVPFALRDARDQYARQREDDEREQEQHEAQRDQRRAVDRIGRLVELVGERRGDRVAGLEQSGLDPVGVADDERHGHRLAERAAEPQHDAADHADARVRQHDVPHDLPGRRAEGRKPTP
jgi:hypothetical protein